MHEEHDPGLQGWHVLGEVEPSNLVDARLQLHWAAQVLSAVGYTHMEKASDDGQSNTGWVDGMQVLVGRPMEVEPGAFVSLDPANFRIALHEPGGAELESLAIAGQTLEQLHEWTSAAIGRRLGADPVELVRPTYDLPDHPVADGQAFGADPAALSELGRWIHNGNLVMRDLRAGHRGATMPRLWPHHFDMGMLISLEEHGNAAEGRSIGLGLSLGDDTSEAPYWYASPYPNPVDVEVPALKHGEWEDGDWFGAKLHAPAALSGSDAPAQHRVADEFVAEMVLVCKKLLG